MKKTLILFLAAASLTIVSGCVSSSNSGGTADAPVYANGELSDALVASLMDAHVATLAGARDLQLTTISDSKSLSHASITLRTTTDIKIDVILIKQTRTLTQIRVRSGAAGDEQLSRELLAKIKTHL